MLNFWYVHSLSMLMTSEQGAHVRLVRHPNLKEEFKWEENCMSETFRSLPLRAR